MIDERIQSLANSGAEINIKIDKRRAVVIVSLEEETYSASGKNVETALERCLSAVGNHDKNVRAKRKQKEIRRQELLDESYDLPGNWSDKDY
jgi:hypothetical protein